jgi:cholesterol transport system auxiliary component
MRNLALMGLALLLAGCGGLRSNKEAERIYVLHPAALVPGGDAVPGVVRIARPEVQPGLDTEHIVLTRAGNELDYFADSRWGESLPQVLLAFATESLARSGQFQTVVATAPGSVPSDYEVLLTARHFEADYVGSAVQARVAFDCVLTAGNPRRVLGRCDAEVVEAAGENRMSEIVAALQSAAQKAMTTIGTRSAELIRGSLRK